MAREKRSTASSARTLGAAQRAKQKKACLEAARYADSIMGTARIAGIAFQTLYHWYRVDADFHKALDETILEHGQPHVHQHRLDTAQQLTTDGMPKEVVTRIVERDPKTGEMVTVKETTKLERVVDTTVLLRALAKSDPGWRSQLVTVGTDGAGEPLDTRLERIAEEDRAAERPADE